MEQGYEQHGDVVEDKGVRSVKRGVSLVSSSGNTQDGPADEHAYGGDGAVTDFDTWAQASAALQQGMSAAQLVAREFQRTYPEVEHVTVVRTKRGLTALMDEYERCAPGSVAV